MNQTAKTCALTLIRLEGKENLSKECQQEVGDYIWRLVLLGMEEFRQVKEARSPAVLAESFAELVSKSLQDACTREIPGWNGWPIRKRIEDAYLHLRRHFIHTYSGE